MNQDDSSPDDPKRGLFESSGPWRSTKVVALAARSAPSGRLQTLRILVAGEDVELTEQVQDLLGRMGAGRYVTSSIADLSVSSKLDVQHYDAVLVASDPFGALGFAAFTSLRARGCLAPIVLVAATLEEDTVERAIEQGLADVVELADLDATTLDRVVRTSIARSRRDIRHHADARRDELTGLANRLSFRDRLEHALALARRGNARVAVMLIDLNSFKAVNDQVGHSGGDLLLKRLGERLKSRVRESDTVARLGGDEFGILLPGLARPEDAAVVVRKVMESIRPPIDVDGRAIRVTASLGIALFPEHAQDADQLVRLADSAMYRAKAQGNHACSWYGKGGAGSLTPEADALARAFEAGAVEVLFQPQISLAGSLIAVSLRPVWRHPTDGLVDLVELRDLVDEAGLTERISDRLAQATLDQLAAWTARGLGHVRASVPLLTRRRLAWAGIAERFRARPDSAMPRHLEIEIDEAVLIEDHNGDGRGVAALQRAGLQIAIDRFGAGLTALSLLTALKPASVRLPPHLSASEDSGQPEHELAAAIVRVARSMGVRTIATGADNPARMRIARALHYDAVEGGLGASMNAADCLHWLEATNRRVAARPQPPADPA